MPRCPDPKEYEGHLGKKSCSFKELHGGLPLIGGYGGYGDGLEGGRYGGGRYGGGRYISKNFIRMASKTRMPSKLRMASRRKPYAHF